MAFKWFFPRVNSRVCPQVRVLGERFVTKLTAKRSISSVSPDVIPKVWRFPEGLLAMHALKSLLFLSPLFLMRWRQRGRGRRKWKGERKRCLIVHGFILLLEQRGLSFFPEPTHHVMRFYLGQVMLVKVIGIHCSDAQLTVAASAIWKVSKVNF